MNIIEITVPGSKSLTNRAIIMASLSNGLSKISNISNSVDSQIMIKALRKLGVKIRNNKNGLLIIGNKSFFPEFNGNINVGNAGTVARFLTALITLVPGKVVIKKSERMKIRPMKELADVLKKIKTGKVSIRGDISSQFVSALLMISPVLDKGLAINIIGQKVSDSYIDMTINLMKKFGVKVKKINGNKFIIKKQSYRQTNYVIEGDLSAASYFLGIAAVTGKKIRVNVDPKSIQGDVKFVDILEKMGCKVTKNFKKSWIMVEGSKKLNGVRVNMNLMPDTAQTLAVVAAFAEGKTTISGLSTLKVKETDRLLALKKELGKMKIKSEITKDSIEIEGGTPQRTTIETYDDHRMAMAFAVAKSRIPELIIKNPEVVSKSFPEFWKRFNLIKI